MREKITFDGYFYFSYLEPTEIEHFVMAKQPKEFNLLLTKYSMEEKRGKSVMGDNKSDCWEKSLLREMDRKFEEVAKEFNPHIEDESEDFEVDSLQFDFRTSKHERNLGNVSILHDRTQPIRIETELSGSIITENRGFTNIKRTESLSNKIKHSNQPFARTEQTSNVSKHDSLRLIQIPERRLPELSIEKDDESFHNEHSGKEVPLLDEIKHFKGLEYSSQIKASVFNLYNPNRPSSVTLTNEMLEQKVSRKRSQHNDQETSNFSESAKIIRTREIKNSSIEELVKPKLESRPEQTSDGLTIFNGSSTINQAFDKLDSQQTKNMQAQNTQSLQVINEDRLESKADESTEKRQLTKFGSVERLNVTGQSPLLRSKELNFAQKIERVPTVTSSEKRSQLSKQTQPIIVVHHSIASKSRLNSRRHSRDSNKSDSKTSIDAGRQHPSFVIKEYKEQHRRGSYESFAPVTHQLAVKPKPGRPAIKMLNPFYHKPGSFKKLDSNQPDSSQLNISRDDLHDSSSLKKILRKAKGKDASMIDDSLFMDVTPKNEAVPLMNILAPVQQQNKKPESRFSLYAAKCL